MCPEAYETIKLGTQTVLSIEIEDLYGDAVELNVASCLITIRRKRDNFRVVDALAVEAGTLTNHLKYEWEPDAIGDYEVEWLIVDLAEGREEYSPTYSISVVRRIAA